MLGLLNYIASPIGLISLGLLVLCVVHSVRTGNVFPWIYVMVFLPGIGPLIYFFFVSLEAYGGDDGLRFTGDIGFIDAATNALADAGYDAATTFDTLFYYLTFAVLLAVLYGTFRLVTLVMNVLYVRPRVDVIFHSPNRDDLPKKITAPKFIRETPFQSQILETSDGRTLEIRYLAYGGNSRVELILGLKQFADLAAAGAIAEHELARPAQHDLEVPQRRRYRVEVAIDDQPQLLGVDARHQSGRGIARDQLAVVDDGDAVAQLLGLGQIVRGQQDRGAGGVERADIRPQLLAQFDIDAGGGLVEH